MVRCRDKKTAEAVKPGRPPELIFLDPDGDEIFRTAVKGAASVEAAMKTALKKYGPKEISWNREIGEAREQAEKKGLLLALAFVEDKKSSEDFLKALENRWIAKLHDKIVFVKCAFDKKSELCHEWKVYGVPALVLVDPKEEDANKRVLERVISKKDVRSLRKAILKALERLEKASK